MKVMKKENAKAHKHIWKLENKYRMYDLFKCRCGKTKKVLIK